MHYEKRKRWYISIFYQTTCFRKKCCVNDKIWEFTSHKFIVADVLFLCTDEIKCGWSSKDFLPWTTTLLSSVLSLFLTVIYVIKCSFWAKLKGILLCFLFYRSWNTNLFVFLFQPKKVNFFLKKKSRHPRKFTLLLNELYCWIGLKNTRYVCPNQNFVKDFVTFLLYAHHSWC